VAASLVAVPSLSAAEVTSPGAELQLVADGYSFTEGPTADEVGNVYFNPCTSTTNGAESPTSDRINFGCFQRCVVWVGHGANEPKASFNRAWLRLTPLNEKFTASASQLMIASNQVSAP
jgi:hypothetical protein